MAKFDYEQMKQVDIRTVNADILVDIDEVEIDASLSKEKRMQQFIEKVKNPFCFKCNGMIVKTVYNEEEGNLEEKLVGLLMAMSGIM
ncbi:MAG: hypothetical protein PHN80_04975 [Hespellia sp.]|nr:hypothetical protein [Hespellia sp.]